jgi:magnesium-transporting ATPase (P-type)
LITSARAESSDGIHAEGSNSQKRIERSRQSDRAGDADGEVFAVCARYEIDGEVGPLDQSHLDTAQQESAALNADGFRVIAVAYKELMAPIQVLHIIRTAKIPFVESRASPALMATSVVICMIGIALPFTSLGASLGFVPLPALYWPAVIAIIGCYAAVTHYVKTWSVRRWGM